MTEKTEETKKTEATEAATEKKVAMSHAVSLDYTEEWQEPGFTGPRFPTFVLGAIPTRLYAAFSDEAVKSIASETRTDGRVEMQFNANQQAVSLVTAGLRGSSNFKDRTGREVPYVTQELRVGTKTFNVAADEFVDMIPLRTTRAMAKKIRELCGFTEEDEKN